MQITHRIHFDNLRGDIFGGLTAAIVSLPLALAFGVASGAGAIVASLTAKNPELGSAEKVIEKHRSLNQ